MKSLKNNQRGFIALFTVIIVSFVLLLIAITVNFSGFSGRFNIFNSENKERSAKLADACIEHARLLVAQGSSSSPSTSLDVGTEKCRYKILNSGNNIRACAQVNKAFTYYNVDVNKNIPNIPITNFTELGEDSNLSPCP